VKTGALHVLLPLGTVLLDSWTVTEHGHDVGQFVAESLEKEFFVVFQQQEDVECHGHPFEIAAPQTRVVRVGKFDGHIAHQPG
jgi:hypothetical protein